MKHPPRKNVRCELREMCAWLASDESPEEKRYEKCIVNSFMNSILRENPDPSDEEFSTAMENSLKQSDQVRSLLNGHVSAWLGAKKNVKFLMSWNVELKLAIEEFLRNSRPVVDWINQFSITAIVEEKHLSPEQKAIELFFTILTSSDSEWIRPCRGCKKLFLPERQNKQSCSLRCHRKFHRQTPEGRQRRAAAKRRSRTARRELKQGAMLRNDKRKEALITKSARLRASK